ncbi:MAG: phosphotransferase [Ilumatobacter sp.]|uniref:phosphotransferase n=1 Tax=Ilumatobacter sp. TaxID=1967498 RepID=UPI00329909BF
MTSTSRGRLDPAALRFDPPSVPLDQISETLAEHWGLSGRLRPLDGERDQNTQVTTPDGRDFVLKIASPSEDPLTADFQCAALRHVAAADSSIGVPHVVPTADGHDIVSTSVDGSPAPTRLLTFVEGITFDDAGTLDLAALMEVGASQGRLARAFRGLEHPAAGNFMAWSLDAGMIHHDDLWDGLGEAGRAAAGPFRERVDAVATRIESADPALRRQVVHNDGHRGNLLRSDASSTEVTGVIDFGDIADTCVVADLAICVASFVDGHPDQADAAASIAAGYDRWMSLTDTEIEVLVDAVLQRIVLGLLLVEFQRRHAPEHRLGEIGDGLSEYRANMTAWAALDIGRTTDVIMRRIERDRADRGGAT